MWGHKMGKILAVCTSMLLMQSCTQSLDGGSIQKTFLGIEQATVLGPETVEVTWSTNSKCRTYEIYLISSSASSSVASAALPPVRLKSPTIVDQQAYTFAVGCSSGTAVSGQDVQLSATTWTKFSGVVTSQIDSTGQNPLLVLNWSYAQNTGTLFKVYAKESIVPGDLTSPTPWQLTRPGAAGTAYSETPICSTYSQEVRIGVGGNCNASLKPGVTYNFKVVAQYPDATYSNDIAGNGTTQAVPAIFTPPNCVLTQTGIGSDATSSYLFLRCEASTGACPSVSVKAYQVRGGTRSVVSDSLVVPGTLRIQPTVEASAANTRLVEGLEVDYTCNTSTPSVATVRYDNTGSPVNKKPSMKYGNDGYEAAPPQSYAAGQHPSNLGLVTAVGDYNCDGKPDIAVGLPNITFNSAPYYNKNSGSGAVKIYYNYAWDAATGTFHGDSTQYLSFRDLPASAGFGRSLSSGNINKDVYADYGSPGGFFSCDDLIVGAAGANGTGTMTTPSTGYNFTGAAYIFYGQRQKFPQPLDSAGLALNAPTCTGTITNEICSVVRLSPDISTWLKVSPSYTSESTTTNSALGMSAQAAGSESFSAFGFQVSYIRDFNADGYGDIAIGDPFCDWDGEIRNNYVANPQSGYRETIRRVGCVYVYWGGPSGIANVKMGTTPDGLYSLTSPFTKIYPPIPEAGMHFGWSISGGGDVDGRPPVPVRRNGGNNIILANGSDFIVGAPDFVYTPTTNGVSGDDAEGTNIKRAWTVVSPNDASGGKGSCSAAANGTSCSVDPLVNLGISSYGTQDSAPGSKLVIPWNGAWSQDPSTWAGGGLKGPAIPTAGAQTPLRNSTGIAFLYLGRSPLEGYGITVDDGFTKYPNRVNNIDPSDPIEGLLSANYRDRTNGSQYMRVASFNWTTDGWLLNPVDAFYNCGSRGSPTGNSTAAPGGYYKHVSCLAGRNNFSVIYPSLKSTDSAVTRFGSKVQIAGGNDQNAVALYELGAAVGTTAGFASAYTRTSSGDLAALSQGSVHDHIRGTNLWELGIKGISAPGADAAGYESYQSWSSGNKICSNCLSGGYSGVLSRSAITESYSFPGIFTTTPAAKPLNDINLDGYADVVVASDSGKVFTYYGNYAADFSYQGNTNTTSPNCVVTRLSARQHCGDDSTSYDTALPGCSALSGSGNNTGIVPFVTYRGYASALTTATSTISPQYPEAYIPQSGKYARLSYLDDTAEAAATTISFDYPTLTRGAKSTSALSCVPLVKSYASAATSLSAADMNNDGIIDVAIGFSGDSSGLGKTVISTAGANGIGLQLDTSYTVNSTNAKNGSSVLASNWLFLDGTSRRDLFSGASGYSSGAGAIYDYTASNMATLTNVPTNTLLEDSNFPNNLKAERSKGIGDVNGDGYDDILVPVRQVSANGSVYYDGLIYFGSQFGPVTYSFCINKISSIVSSGGAAISSSDCLGSTNSATAFIGAIQIRLPQYLNLPTGVTSSWTLSAYPAGDVDHDGNADVLIMDFSNTGMYLYFGSSSGIINGTPHAGPMVNHAPQLVTQSPEIFNYAVSVGGISQTIHTWYSRLDFGVGRTTVAPSVQNYPLTHGDFNGDGYQDLAITIGVAPPSLSASGNPWDCTAADVADLNIWLCFGGATKNSPGSRDGAVFVIYGGVNGYQTPVNGSQVPVAFDSLTISGCKNFYHFTDGAGSTDTNSCYYPGNGNAHTMNYVTEVYDTLIVDGSNDWTLDTNRTACNPSSNTCKAEVIRKPTFYNVDGNGGFWRNMVGTTGFASNITVADVNNDGIDDLLVSDSKYSLPGFSGTGSNIDLMPSNSVLTEADAINGMPAAEGRVYIYYGAKGAGLVAPNAARMVGDLGLGLVPSVSPVASHSAHPPFAIYPEPANKVSASTSYWPELESSSMSYAVATSKAPGSYRQFGINTSSGDFNGDGIDDVAVVSNYGQLYIYYGPICQFDNEDSTWQTSYLPANHNKGTIASGVGATHCTQFDFNKTLTASSTSNSITVAAVTKTMYPQMVYVSGTSTADFFGSVLISKRPTRAPASKTAVSYPGNIDNDPEKTSDLIIGSNTMQDPNVTQTAGTNTGLAYVFFGHKKPGVGEMPTTPGLYVGNASYNSGLLSKTISSNTYFYHQPVLVKPYTSDGLTGQFFFYESTMGDFNGDGTADLVIPTADIHFGADANHTPVVTGGGFKIIY